MKIEQIYTGCLAQGAYYIHDSGEAAIIDPLREVQSYIDRAQRDGVTIKYVFETHFHADFVSGHVDLAARSNATIVYGPTANPGFAAYIAKDGEQFKIGSCTLRAIHTPGHTMESTCFVLADASGKDLALFSGDTLFLGDVGRPDLAQKAAHMTQEELAGQLYDSLYSKILPLADDIMVYPAHGAGSACGKNMMKETQDLLGNQKQRNYALNQPNKATFIKSVLDGLMPPPVYFPHNVALNKQGYKPMHQVLQEGLKPLSADAFKSAAQQENTVILDTRNPADFAKGHIPGSIQIGLSGEFAPWVGALIGDVKQPLLLVCEPGTETEVITRLSRVGFDQVKGYLETGIAAWKSSGFEMDIVNRISADQMQAQITTTDTVIDVRRPSEYSVRHMSQSVLKPLDQINSWFNTIHNNSKPFYLHCAGGYRSMMAASILKARGIHDFFEIEGGFSAISKTELPLTQELSTCTN